MPSLKSLALAALLTASLAATAARAEDSLPRFADYPVAAISKGKAARVVIADKHTREYRTRLRDAFAEATKPDFAGRYVRVTWGCGTACVEGALIDLPTGKVTFLPFRLSDWRETFDAFEPVEVRPNSRLIVFSGARDEEGVVGLHFYVLEDGRFKFIKTVDTGGNFLKPLQ